MNKMYDAPEMEIVEFITEDIVTASTTGLGDGGEITDVTGDASWDTWQ